MKIGHYTIETIAPGTTLFEERYFGSPCLMYLVEGDDAALLIDTGLGSGNLAAIVGKLTQKPVTVVNTHGHFDHIGGNWQFENIYLHEDEKPVLDMHMSREYLLQKSKEMLPGWMRLFVVPFVVSKLTPKQGGRYHFIRDGYRFDLGGRQLEVIHTPGHSVGSICLLDRGNGLLFTGDTVCDLGIMISLEGSTTANVYLQSVERLQAIVKHDDKFYPGHHKRPIDSSYLEEYAACARQVIAGDFTPTAPKALFNGAQYGRISIDLPAEMRTKR